VRNFVWHAGRRGGLSAPIAAAARTACSDGREERHRPKLDAAPCDPDDDAAVFALEQLPRCDVRELLLCPAKESSWP
jgi:hypothetical protein